MKHKLLLTSLLIFLFNVSYSQIVGVKEIRYEPQDVSDQDTVILYFDYSFNYTPCARDSIHISIISNSSVTVDAYYRVGDGAAPCQEKDSIVLGRIPAGDYEVFLNLISFDHHGYNYGDTILLSVAGDVLLGNIIDDKNFKISPNPASNVILIHAIETETQVEIRNLMGQLLISNNSTDVIDISSLRNGAYIISVQSGNKRILNEILIVNH